MNTESEGRRSEGRNPKAERNPKSEIRDPNGSGEIGERTAEVFINKAETARRLGCGIRTVDAWMRLGIVPFYKVSKRVMFRWSEVQAVLERNCRVDRGGSWKV